MYEIWSLGHKPFEEYGHMEVGHLFDLVDIYLKLLLLLLLGHSTCE